MKRTWIEDIVCRALAWGPIPETEKSAGAPKPRRRAAWVRLLSLGVGAVVAGAVTVAGPAPVSAAPAQYCAVSTLMHDAVVRENPDTNSVVLKWKHRGNYISHPCDSEYPHVLVTDIESGVPFLSVNCTCATDGIGWIRQDAFTP